LSQELKKVEYVLLSDKDAANAINLLPLVESDLLAVSAEKARAYFVSDKAQGAWRKLHIIENDLNDILFEIVSLILTVCRLEGGSFNLDKNTEVGRINNDGLGHLVALGVLPNKEDFLDLSKEYLRRFPVVTPQDVSSARLFGESHSKQTGYPYFNSVISHHTKGAEDFVRITAVLEQTCKVDVEVSLFTWVDDQDTNTFNKLPYPDKVIIPKGYKQISLDVSAKKLSKVSRFTGVSNTLQGFRLSVKAV
jgi:hypothetical protein